MQSPHSNNHYFLPNTTYFNFCSTPQQVKVESTMVPPHQMVIPKPDSPVAKVPKKRGRKSLIPIEERESTRRFKKRNMERKRRAYIADKMTALHNLTLSLVGEDPSKHQKMEKADILNLCHSVMRSLSEVVAANPELAEKVRSQVGDQIKDLESARSVATGVSHDDDSDVFDEGIVDVEAVDENKENQDPEISRFSAFRRTSTFSSSSLTSSSLFTSSTSNSRTSSSGFSSTNLSSPGQLLWRPF
ncbi:hypothetical protein Ciccas_002343 [Cichlidogyrus casuarinus]|uniref:BHLH domain-containing protein n=1 Tax=Cichlidogyrus casuarinus TaxID=1844966 RepID=A0ABD2QKQ0_9PLAT